jgi:hypothetical protein
MPTSVERPAYFAGEYLSTDDYIAEQRYQDGLRRAHDGALHTWGIASGLEATSASGQVVVAPGVAVDPGGELVVLEAPMSLALPTGGETILAVALEAITLAPDRPDGLPRVEQAAALSWVTALGPRQIALATLSTGTLDPSIRRYVGMKIGSMAFIAPGIQARSPSIVGWGASQSHGLRITADRVAFDAPGGTAELVIHSGLLGVGTMSPEAALDVQEPNEPSKGVGQISSVGTTVTGSDPQISMVVEPGDTIVSTNRKGQPVEATVLTVVAHGRLEMDTALDVQSASWELRRKYVARLQSDKGALVVGDHDLYVGIGTPSPSMRLEITGGDLLLGSGAREVRFEGDGKIVSEDRSHQILFNGKDQLFSLRDQGGITLVAGGATPGLSLLANGDVGLGTASPANALVVVGTVYASDGYVFPDGSVQTEAGVPVPIGGIIEWWRPAASTQVPLEFRICDGSVVHDPASPFDKKAVPNLTGYFIRGCAKQADAGPGPSTSETHTHVYDVPSHTHPFLHTHPPQLDGQTGAGNDPHGPDDRAASDFCDGGHTHMFVATSAVQPADERDTQPNSDAGDPLVTGPATSLPPFYGLLKLIRIR